MKVSPLFTRISPFIFARTQCRQLHLVHEIFTNAPTGKLATCEKLNLEIQPKPFQLATLSGLVTVNSVIEALGYIKPMTHLMKLDRQKIYQITALNPPPPLEYEKKSKSLKRFLKTRRRDGDAHEIEFTTGCNSTNLEKALSNAYQMLARKSKHARRVEFHLRVVGNRSIEWALEKFPHLRPEMILAAMPEQTAVLAPPLAYGKNELMWALHRRPKMFEIIGKNKSEEPESRDLKDKDVSESNDSKNREPSPVQVGEGADVDKAQAATDVSRSETNVAKPPETDSCIENSHETIWDRPCETFSKAWKREAYEESTRYLTKTAQKGMRAERVERYAMRRGPPKGKAFLWNRLRAKRLKRIKKGAEATAKLIQKGQEVPILKNPEVLGPWDQRVKKSKRVKKSQRVEESSTYDMSMDDVL